MGQLANNMPLTHWQRNYPAGAALRRLSLLRIENSEG